MSAVLALVALGALVALHQWRVRTRARYDAHVSRSWLEAHRQETDKMP